MSLAVFNSAAFTTATGLAIGANATIEVRRESDNNLASIFSDAAGAVGITNPSAFADSSGRFKFYVAGNAGGYKVKVTKGAETYTLRSVAIGTAAELDAADLLASASAAAGIALAKVIYGLTYGPGDGAGGGDLVNDITVFAGGARDASNAYTIVGAQLTKRLDAAWDVGNNQGGLDTGSIGNSDYYVWAIARSDTGVVDYLFSLSSTSPTMPTNYDCRRLIGWFKRVSGSIVAFKTYETEGGGLEFLWNSPTLDINLAATLTTSRRTDAVKVPLTFSVTAILNAFILDAASGVNVYIYCPDTADLAPSTSATPLGTMQSATTVNAMQEVRVRTSSAGLIAARADVATVDNYRVATIGFTWARR